MSKENKTFEQTLIELQEISRQLEDENLPLQKAIELFEEGIKLSKDCQDKLKSAKQRIEKITDTEIGADD